MLPGLRAEPAGSVKAASATLALRAGKVEVTLTVNAQAAGNALTIQMPRFGWLGESEMYPDRQFPELEILVNGAPAKMESSFAAFVGTEDVTNAVRKAGVDPFAIADTPPFVTATGGAQAMDALLRVGAVEKSGSDYIAKWTAQRKVRVTLAAGRSTVTLIYKARPAIALRRFEQTTRASSLAPVCLTAADLSAALGHPAAAITFVVTEYAIPLSVGDVAPAEDVTISADVSEAGTRPLVAFCGAGGKTVTGKNASAKTPALVDAKGIARIFVVASSK
jgi:hypothetical protein